ncbi:MAG: hypothetical protein RL095_346 [Verrucomicrobiota bacterium]|jgi:Arc/MetJ family transcription regulator
MSTLQVDDLLLEEALRLGHHKTKKDAVNQALLEYTRHLRQMEAIKLFGTIDIPADYDYKSHRGS